MASALDKHFNLRLPYLFRFPTTFPLQSLAASKWFKCPNTVVDYHVIGPTKKIPTKMQILRCKSTIPAGELTFLAEMNWVEQSSRRVISWSQARLQRLLPGRQIANSYIGNSGEFIFPAESEITAPSRGPKTHPFKVLFWAAR